MNRDKLLYELANINRNIEKLNLVLEDLNGLAQDDSLWDIDHTVDSETTATQLCSLVEEGRCDITNMSSCCDALHASIEKGLTQAGYKRAFGSYGEWVKDNGEQ